MTQYRSQIVGAHFRPPAKVLLAHAPSGALLGLEPEPENPYDEFAIRVMLPIHSIPESEHEALRDECASCGADWDDLVLLQQPVHIGYCISASNKKLGAWTPNTVVADAISHRNHEARLAFSDEGEAYALITIPEGAEGVDEEC